MALGLAEGVADRLGRGVLLEPDVAGVALTAGVDAAGAGGWMTCGTAAAGTVVADFDAPGNFAAARPSTAAEVVAVNPCPPQATGTTATDVIPAAVNRSPTAMRRRLATLVDRGTADGAGAVVDGGGVGGGV